jgi:CBS domain-containing protein
MRVGDYSKKVAISIRGSADVAEAARLMLDQHVGFLIVYQEGDDLRRPIGVLTDRDIVRAATARSGNPRSVTVADVMTPEPLIARDSDELSALLRATRVAGIRRVPVVDRRGALVGTIAVDDIIGAIVGLICDMAGSIRSGQRREWRSRSA